MWLRTSMIATIVSILVACSGNNNGSGDSGGGDGGADAQDAMHVGDGGVVDGDAARDGGSCAITVTRASPSIVLQGSTNVALHLTGTGFDATTTVTIQGMPAPIATSPAPTATAITVSAPDAVFAAIGPLHLSVSGAGCASGIIASVIVRSPTSLASAGWPRHHHDNQNTSVTSAVVAATPTLRWSHSLGSESSGVASEGGGAWSEPVVAPDPAHLSDETGAPDLVWDGAPNGTVWSFAADGTTRWHFTTVGTNMWGIDSVPAVRADGTLYVGISDSNLYAIDVGGTRQWAFPTMGTSDASAIVTENGTLLYASDDGHVYALDARGTMQWITADPGEVDSAFATAPQAFGDVGMPVYFAGGQNGWFALDPHDGRTLWHVPAQGGRGAGVSSPVVSPDGTTVYGIDSGGRLVAINAVSGTEMWHVDIVSGGGNTPALVGDTLYAVFFDGHVRALNAHDGSVRWDRDVHLTLLNTAGELATPSVDGAGNVFVFSDDGNLYGFAHDGTPRTPIHVCPPRSMFIVPQVAIGSDGTVYIAGTDDTLYAYR